MIVSTNLINIWLVEIKNFFGINIFTLIIKTCNLIAMIIGVGNDIVAISKIAEVYFKFEDKFLQRIYSNSEIEIAKSILKNNNQKRMINFLAKRFCVKEAFGKAIGLGLGRGINFKDIAVENNDLGKPLIKILPQKEQFLKKHLACQNYSIHLSLSDTEDLAFAVVIIEKIN